jgi:transcriptional regulator GlxA family with amidase domain
MNSDTRRVVLVAIDRMELLDLVGPASVLDGATRALRLDPGMDPASYAAIPRGDELPGSDAVPALGGVPGSGAASGSGAPPGYELVVATPDGNGVRSASGVRIEADVALPEVDPAAVDTVIVAGGLFVAEVIGDARIVESLRQIAPHARRTCSVCSGTFLLGAAGLLEGRRATTHWAASELLAQAFPGVRVEPDRIFIRDGAIITSAGVTAGMDLTLALVEEDHGAEIARTVARWMVMFVQRPGGQSQFSERLNVLVPEGSPIRGLLDEIAADPAGDHRVPALAHRAALSERHLTRIFAVQTHTTPARFVERVRVEAARTLLERGGMSTEAVASTSGFGSIETMRRAFLRVLGVAPGEYRRRFHSTNDQPRLERSAA